MSKVNFENCPPVGAPPAATFKPGDWVKCVFTGGHGVVQNANSDAAFVIWASGEQSTEPVGTLAPSAPTMYFAAIRQAAESELEMDAATLSTLHDELAGERDPMSLAVLSELEAKILGQAPENVDDGAWEAVEQTAALEQAKELAAEGDIFGAFGLLVESKKSEPQVLTLGVNWGEPVSRVTAGAHPHHEGMFACFIDGETVETHDTLEEAQAMIPEWEQCMREDGDDPFGPAPVKEPESETTERDPRKCAICQDVKINKNSPTLQDGSRVCKKCQLESQTVSDADASTDTTDTSKANAPSPTAENAADATTGESRTAELMERLAQTAADMKQELEVKQELTEFFQGKQNASAQDVSAGSVLADAQAGSADTAADAPAPPPGGLTEPVKTDAGLIDPETGELVSESLIMRKFGWTEMPSLPEKPTKEQLDAYQDKIDQIGDRVLNHRERAARYRAQAEERCKPLDSAADFWDDNFVKPMAKALGKHRMPVKGKTLHLPSCSVKYTQSGGAYVHDSDLVKKHIFATGMDKFAAIEAELVVSYDYSKLIAALNRGTLKDIPGTGMKPKDPLAKVTVVSPSAKNTDRKEEESDDS